MSSAAVVVGALRVNMEIGPKLIEKCFITKKLKEKFLSANFEKNLSPIKAISY